jgi:hypothetical protein
LNDRLKQEMRGIIEEALQGFEDRILAAMGRPIPSQATKEQRAYLEERGWLETSASRDENGVGPGWFDMRPPMPERKLMSIIKDERTGRELKRIEQTTCHGAPGQHYTLDLALETERKRNRQPLPLFDVVECTGNPAPNYEKGTVGYHPINLQQWVVRDRQLRKVAGPFETRQQAEGHMASLLAKKAS